MAGVLTESDIHEQLTHIAGWVLKDGAIERTFEFDTFPQGIAFINEIAEAAEDAQHHPDIDVRYTKVHLKLVSHDAGGITNRDLEMAKKINELA